MEPTAPRLLPALDEANRPFWTGGADGLLLIGWCAACQRWAHPPQERCPTCGEPLEPRPVSGRGTVFTFTVNAQQFHPDVPAPYVVAIVQLVEQDDLRLPTNIVGCDPDEVAVGMPVRVDFELHGEHAVPVFRPDDP